MEKSFKKCLSRYGLIRLLIMINGEPFYFLVDTGCNTNYITPETAERLHKRIQVVGEGSTQAYRGKSKRELIVEIMFKFNYEWLTLNFNIMRDTSSFMNLEREGIHFDGILGTPFLYASKATIDFADLKIKADNKREQKDLEGTPWYVL